VPTTRWTTATALVLFMAGCWDQPSSSEDEEPIGIQDNLTTGLIERVYVGRRDTWSYWYQGENFGTAWREHAWTPPAGQTSGVAPSASGGSSCVNAGDPAVLDVNGSRADMGSHGGP
jgi:hypothetical protein